MSINNTLNTPFYFSSAALATSAELGQFPIALAGRGYLADMTRYQRRILEAVTQQFDEGSEVTERSLSREAFWTREQTSWSHGAGQETFDLPFQASDRQRFLTSKGIDPWTEGEICLHRDTELVIAEATNTNLQVFTVGGLFYVVNGDTLSYGDDPGGTLTDIVFTEPIFDTVTDGNRIYVAFGAADVLHVVDVDDGTPAALGTSNPEILGFANGRLIGADGPAIYEIDAAGATTAIGTDFRDGFRWTSIAGHPNAIFATGHVGEIGEFWASTIASDTSLGALAFAGHLPFGEIPLTMRTYAGVVAIGTSLGLRAGLVNQLTIEYGELIEAGPVRSLAVRDRFCWFTWSDFDGLSTGLGRADLSVSTSSTTFAPAWATDLMATAQGTSASVTIHDGDPYFAVAGVGIFGPTDELVPSGSLETGEIRYSVLPPKVFTAVDVHHNPLRGTVAAEALRVDGSTRSLGQASSPGGVESHLSSAQATGRSIGLRLTLLRDQNDETLGPCVRAWVLHALPRPRRIIEFIVPLVLKTRVRSLQNDEIYFDPLAELRRLDSLASSAQLVTYQEGPATYTVRIDSVGIGEGDMRSWQRDDQGEGVWFETTLMVRLLSRESRRT